MKRKLLFVDDDDTFRGIMSRELELMGYEVHAFPDGEAALARLAEAEEEVKIDLALIDLRMPGIDGFELLSRLKVVRPATPVIVLTGHGSVPDAVRAMQEGAYDFLAKPVSLDVMEKCLARATEHSTLALENSRLREIVHRSSSSSTDLLGDSPAMQELRTLLTRVADSDANVLIVGENGTGKELVANRIHELSPRRDRPFIVVNSGAIPDDLIESELFGHVRGAFTGADKARIGLFEAADGGTIFLDEIGELPLATQPSLLRAAQFGEVRPVGSTKTQRVDVRILAATNRQLVEDVEAGRFREDLYYRVSTLVVQAPSLRDRRADITPLARVFLERFNARRPADGQRSFDDKVPALLSARDWPGNVRELQNAVTRLATLAAGETITPTDVERHVDVRKRPDGGLPTLNVDTLERMAIVQALQAHRGKRMEAAAELGVAVKTLYNKIRAYEIDEDEYLRAE